MNIEKSKTTIKSRVTVHDRTQVETVFSYNLRSTRKDVADKHHYRVDAFLFLPVQSGVTPSNYSRQQFYGDLRAFLRFREPRLTYRELVADRPEDSNKRSPLLFFKNTIEKAVADPKVLDVDSAIDEARFFGCSYMSYFWRRVDRRVKRLRFLREAKKDLSIEDLQALNQTILDNTLKFIKRGYSLLTMWRTLCAQAKVLNSDLERLHAEMNLVDEYCSYCFRDGLLSLLKELGDDEASFDHSMAAKLEHKIRIHLRFERWYAQKQKFIWIYEDSDHAEKERYVFRRGALKRRIWSVLYLNPRTDLIFRFQQQLGPMISAGAAAAWAMAASLLILTNSDIRSSQFMNALSAGSVSFASFALVASYILKDRIKEWGKTWFARGLFIKTPDLSNIIQYRASGGKLFKIGVLRESVDFRTPEKIPSEVREIRKTQLAASDNFEDGGGPIMHYRKTITLVPRQLDSLLHPVKAVHDITRFNISSFLPRLDDPLHSAYSLTREGRAVEALMPKVYHIDLILKYSPLASKRKANGSVIDCYRIVFNKKGMVRIERLPTTSAVMGEMQADASRNSL